MYGAVLWIPGRIFMACTGTILLYLPVASRPFPLPALLLVACWTKNAGVGRLIDTRGHELPFASDFHFRIWKVKRRFRSISFGVLPKAIQESRAYTNWMFVLRPASCCEVRKSFCSLFIAIHFSYNSATLRAKCRQLSKIRIYIYTYLLHGAESFLRS